MSYDLEPDYDYEAAAEARQERAARERHRRSLVRYEDETPDELGEEFDDEDDDCCPTGSCNNCDADLWFDDICDECGHENEPGDGEDFDDEEDDQPAM